MTAFVVDTNVAIVANGRGTHADLQCRSSCVEALQLLVSSGIVALDDRDRILDEYARHLSYSGMPGVGDAFFKHIFNSKHRQDRVHLCRVTPCADDRRSFEELPENSFDVADRKFLAVAVVSRATVLNATDSDWSEQEELMDRLGVRVTQLCPQHATRGDERGT